MDKPKQRQVSSGRTSTPRSASPPVASSLYTGKTTLFDTLNPDAIYKQFMDAITDIQRKISSAETLIQDGKKDEFQTILRMQLVDCDSAFNDFLHGIYKYGLAKISLGDWGEKSQKEQIEKQLDKIIVKEMSLAKIRQLATSKSKDPLEWFPGIFDTIYSATTSHSFARPSKIREILNRLSMASDDAICNLMRNKSGGNCYERLNPHDRRNKIVHALDKVNGVQQDITKEYVNDCIYITSNLAGAIVSKAKQMAHVT